jgi:site-specific recombinase XerD
MVSLSPSPPFAGAELDLELTTAVRDAIEASLAPSTRRAYRSDWEDFSGWCQYRHRSPIPAAPDTVAAYITDLAGHGARASTIGRRLAAIRLAHLSADQSSPSTHARVTATHKGLNRTIGTRPDKKAAISAAQLSGMVGGLDASTLAGERDRALLLLGFAGAFRRSELVALDVDDLDFRSEGLLVNLRRSKTDQEGAGRWVAVAYGEHQATCAVRALQGWLAAGGITSGPVFRPVTRHGAAPARRLTSQSVALIVKRAARSVGLDPDQFAGHSLRSGHVTTADANGASFTEIQGQTGHKRVETLLGYIRPTDLLQKTSSRKLGL